MIDREWNRQQVQFARTSTHIDVREGGDGFEQRALSRVDLARNCLNAGLWELLLFTMEDGEERVYEHLWFTFPLGFYKNLFERVNGLSYWSYWWSLEHWVDPLGTPTQVDQLRTVEREWPAQATAQWDESIPAVGDQARKRKNILTPVATTYRDWYSRPNRDEIRGPRKPLSGDGIPRGERGVSLSPGLHLVACGVTGVRANGYTHGDTRSATPAS